MYYKKQQVHKDKTEEEVKRPLSPLIDKEERNKLWNVG